MTKETILLPMLPGQKAEWREAATRAGHRHLTDFIREAVTAAMKRQGTRAGADRVPAEIAALTAELRMAHLQVGRLAGRIRLATYDGAPSEDVCGELDRLMDQVRKTLEAVEGEAQSPKKSRR